MNIAIFIQARNHSTRLPNKINLPFGKSTVLETLIDTCEKVNPLPRAIEVQTHVISSFEDPVPDSYVSNTQGNDLVSRYFDATEHFKPDAIVRVTSDCPLLPQSILEVCITQLLKFDYVSNVNPRTFPDGHDVQGISFEGMKWINTHQTENREHPFFDLEYDYNFEKKFEQAGFTVNRILNGNEMISNPYHPESKLSIDTQEDYERCLKKLS